MKLAAACSSMEVKAKPARGGKRTRASHSTAGALTAKETEKERRQRMKVLCDKLASLIPQEHKPHADTMTQLGSLDVAATYIKKLKERVDELRHKKTSAQAMATLRGVSGISTPTSTTTRSSGEGSPEEEKYLEASVPVVEVRQPDDSSMEVRLICNTERPIKLHEVITILEEEGANIVNANHSVVGHQIFYTIHSQAFSTRIGIDVSRISKRLELLVPGYGDETSTAPLKECIVNKNKGEHKMVKKPEYDSWVEQDQMLCSLLLPISLDSSGHGLAVSTMVDPWSSFGCMLSSQSNEKNFQVHMQLENQGKNGLSTNEYFNKVNELVNGIAMEGSPLVGGDVVSSVLSSLDSNYNPILSMITTENNTAFLGKSSANLDSRGCLGGINRENGHGGLYRVNHEQQEGNGGDNHFQYSNYDNDECSCNQCSKAGHVTLKCWKDFDHTFHGEDDKLPNSTSTYDMDTNWYANKGTPVHITSELARLTVHN